MGRFSGPGDVRHRMAALVRQDGDRRWLSGTGNGSGERRERRERRGCVEEGKKKYGLGFLLILLIITTKRPLCPWSETVDPVKVLSQESTKPRLHPNSLVVFSDTIKPALATNHHCPSTDHYRPTNSDKAELRWRISGRGTRVWLPTVKMEGTGGDGSGLCREQLSTMLLRLGGQSSMEAFLGQRWLAR
ncbi:hypothetical protein ACLB2K_073220 [Fragaria x ananassa]